MQSLDIILDTFHEWIEFQCLSMLDLKFDFKGYFCWMKRYCFKIFTIPKNASRIIFSTNFNYFIIIYTTEFKCIKFFII